MWTLLGMWLEQAAPPPHPPRPTKEQETPEESNISNIPVAMLHEVRVKGFSHPLPFLSPAVTAISIRLSRQERLNMLLGRPILRLLGWLVFLGRGLVGMRPS